MQAPLNPFKTGVSRGPPGISGGPGSLGPHRNSTTAPDPTRGAYSAPPDSLAGIKGAASRQGGVQEGMGRERKGRGGGKGRERKGKDGAGKGKR